MTQIKVYCDEIGEALVDAIETVKAELGLVTVEQGNWASMPAPEEFATSMPMVIVSFLRPEKPDGPRNELGLSKRCFKYHYRIRIFRQQVEGENSARETVQMGERIWQVLTSDATGATVGELMVPLWMKTAIAGCRYDKVEAEGPIMENEDNYVLNTLDYKVNVAWIEVAVTAQSIPTA